MRIFSHPASPTCSSGSTALLLALLLSFSDIPPVSAQELTPEQMESLKARVAGLREGLNSHLNQRNSSAGDEFARALASPKAAVELFCRCTKLVNFDREGRPESDYRAWLDGMKDQFKAVHGRPHDPA